MSNPVEKPEAWYLPMNTAESTAGPILTPSNPINASTRTGERGIAIPLGVALDFVSGLSQQNQHIVCPSTVAFLETTTQELLDPARRLTVLRRTKRDFGPSIVFAGRLRKDLGINTILRWDSVQVHQGQYWRRAEGFFSPILQIAFFTQEDWAAAYKKALSNAACAEARHLLDHRTNLKRLVDHIDDRGLGRSPDSSTVFPPFVQIEVLGKKNKPIVPHINLVNGKVEIVGEVSSRISATVDLLQKQLKDVASQQPYFYIDQLHWWFKPGEPGRMNRLSNQFMRLAVALAGDLPYRFRKDKEHEVPPPK